MEEKTDNIDILEDYIELIEKGYCEDCNELCNISKTPVYPSKAVAQAISTLIAENKELKEEKKNMLETYKKINPEKMKVLADSFNEKVMSKLESDYISKSVIEKKIEEYEKDYDRQDKEGLYNLTKITSGKIASLRELLDERNNTDD